MKTLARITLVACLFSAGLAAEHHHSNTSQYTQVRPSQNMNMQMKSTSDPVVVNGTPSTGPDVQVLYSGDPVVVSDE